MRKIFAFVAAAVAVCLIGCTREMNQDDPVHFVVGSPITLTVTQEPCQMGGTKTIVLNDSEVWWENGDKIGVYASGYSIADIFTSTLNENTYAKTSQFTGTISSSADRYYVLYPSTAAQKDFDVDNQSLSLYLPIEQTARSGSFDKDLMPSFGSFTPSSTSFTMKNLCGGLKFRLSRADVKKIVFEAGGAAGIAGEYTIQVVNSETPVINRSPEAFSAITLIPAGGSFAAEKEYFIVMLPGTLPGFTATLTTTGGEVIKVTSTRTQTVKPGVFGELAKPLDAYADVIKAVAVDLGLSVKWASLNVGATKSEAYGDYFAWGETTPKNDYSWSTYMFELGSGSQGPFSKYVTNPNYGTVDNKTVLDPEDDAASVNWGGSWRMPTKAEWDELLNDCVWFWTSDYNGTGVAGEVVFGNKAGYSDKSIFVPAAGFRGGTELASEGSLCYYWSSSLDPDYPVHAFYLGNNSGSVGIRSGLCRFGHPVRPVTE